MAGDNAECVFIIGFLDAGQTLSLLFPPTAIAACNLSAKTRLLDGGVEDFQEVGSLLAVGLHGCIRGADAIFNYTSCE